MAQPDRNSSAATDKKRIDSALDLVIPYPQGVIAYLTSKPNYCYGSIIASLKTIISGLIALILY
jgi:hypothetical protein